MTRIVVTGGHGQVGQSLREARRAVAAASDWEVVCAPKSRLDITDSASIERAFEEIAPQLVINAAAYTAVDDAERERDAAFAVNRDGAENLAVLCELRGIPLLQLSTDYVFDGVGKTRYREDDRPAPVNVYGYSKWAGELAVQRACRRHIILRTSGVFSRYGRNFVKTIVALARERKRLQVVSDQTACPTSAAEVAAACLEIARQVLENPPGGSAPNANGWGWGIYHYCSRDPVSWWDFANAVVAARREVESLAVERVCAIPASELAAPAARPPHPVLCCDKIESIFGIPARSWRAGLDEVVRNLADER